MRLYRRQMCSARPLRRKSNEFDNCSVFEQLREEFESNSIFFFFVEKIRENRTIPIFSILKPFPEGRLLSFWTPSVYSFRFIRRIYIFKIVFFFFKASTKTVYSRNVCCTKNNIRSYGFSLGVRQKKMHNA